MKKSLILLALPALLLSGCSKEISKEDAKKRAQEIVDHEVKLEDFKKVRVETVEEKKVEGEASGFENTKQVMEYSTDDKWVHSYEVIDGKEGEQTIKREEEGWAYQEDGKYYTVQRINNNGEEKKAYNVYQESDPTWAIEKLAFDAAFSLIQTGTFGSLTGKEALKELIKMIDGGAFDGLTFDLKYFSSGEGNLTVEGKTVDTKYELFGYTGEVTTTAKAGWDKYVMAENSESSEGTLKNADNKELKFTGSSKTTYSYEVGVSKPDLSGYEQGGLN